MSRHKHWLLILSMLLLALAPVSGQVRSAADSMTKDTVPKTDTSVIEPSAVMSEEEEFADDYAPDYALKNTSSVATDTLTKRAVPDSVTEKLKRRKEFEYANDPAYWRVEETEEILPEERKPGFFARLARALGKPAVANFVMVILCAAALYLLARFVINNRLYSFQKKKKPDENSSTADDALLMSSDLDAKIREALARGDYRSAVRLHFLKTLRLLDRKGWIVYHPQTTNLVYRAQVNRYAKGQEFGFLVHAYEYVWFGDFKLKEEQADLVFHRFIHFQNSLKV